MRKKRVTIINILLYSFNTKEKNSNIVPVSAYIEGRHGYMNILMFDYILSVSSYLRFLFLCILFETCVSFAAVLLFHI